MEGQKLLVDLTFCIYVSGKFDFFVLGKSQGSLESDVCDNYVTL